MSYILCLETATTNCSVCVIKEDQVLSCVEDYNTSYSHAERLHLFIQKALEEAEITCNDLAAVSVSKGPGSYTGLRIGVAAAKGLCYALSIPLISVLTLDSLALQVAPLVSESYIIPMLDARRMEVYSAVYSNTHEIIRSTAAEILSETSFDTYFNQGKVYFIGSGVDKFAEICSHKNAEFITNKMPSAKQMACNSYTKFLGKDFENLSFFDPYYLKDFVAG